MCKQHFSVYFNCFKCLTAKVGSCHQTPKSLRFIVCQIVGYNFKFVWRFAYLKYNNDCIINLCGCVL